MLTLKDLQIDHVVKGAVKHVAHEERDGAYCYSVIDWSLISYLIETAVNREIGPTYDASAVYGRDGVELKVWKK